MSNRAERLHEFIIQNGGKVTLGELLQRYDLIGCKHNQAIHELRQILIKENKTIICQNNKKEPTETLYYLKDVYPQYKKIEKGQLVFI